MTTAALELNGKAALLAAEGSAALSAGDTIRASARFKEAGELLEADIANVRKQSEKGVIRFSAATQYYNAGLYSRAEQVSRRIQTRLLPPRLRAALARFRHELKERTAADYNTQTRSRLESARVGKQYDKLLEILQDHPYVLPRGYMAFFRAYCCERLKNYRAAALFFQDTFNFNLDNIDIMYAAAVYPLTLIGAGKLSEAWEYVEHQLASIHHAIPNINASLIRFHQASKAITEKEMNELSEDQIRYCSTAWALFQTMPAHHQKHQDTRDFMALCLEASVFGWRRLGNEPQAAAAADRAVEFDPSSCVAALAAKSEWKRGTVEDGAKIEEVFIDRECRMLHKRQEGKFAEAVLEKAAG